MSISRRALIAGAGAATTGAVLGSASPSHATAPAALARRTAGATALPIASRTASTPGPARVRCTGTSTAGRSPTTRPPGDFGAIALNSVTLR